MDKDGNGVIDRAEWDEMQAKLRDGMVPPRPRPFPETLRDSNGKDFSVPRRLSPRKRSHSPPGAEWWEANGGNPGRGVPHGLVSGGVGHLSLDGDVTGYIGESHRGLSYPHQTRGSGSPVPQLSVPGERTTGMEWADTNSALSSYRSYDTSNAVTPRGQTPRAGGLAQVESRLRWVYEAADGTGVGAIHVVDMARAATSNDWAMDMLLEV